MIVPFVAFFLAVRWLSELRRLLFSSKIFFPPNVKGWPGGEAWITSQTLLARKQFLERLMRVDEARMTPATMEQASMRAFLLPMAPANESVLAAQGVDLLRALVADPAYQLK